MQRKLQQLREHFALLGLCVALLTIAACNSSRDSAASQAAGNAATPSAYKRLVVGDTAPLYVAATLTGDSVHLGAANEPVTVMNVWATWCTSCREEMQDLQGLQNEYRSRGVRVLGISVDEADGIRVRKFVEKEKLTFDIVHDQEGRVQGLYQVSGIPNTFIIARDGRILWKSIGNLHGVVDSLRRVLNTAAK